MPMLVKRLLLPAILLFAAVFLITSWNNDNPQNLSREVYKESSLIRTMNGVAFRDLNKNGKMDVYEDVRQPVEARVSHLAAYLRSFTGQEPSEADVAHFLRFIAAR